MFNPALTRPLAVRHLLRAVAARATGAFKRHALLGLLRRSAGFHTTGAPPGATGA